ncbi:MAG: rRNA (guanosine2251-2-O)-methyltransferase [Candidatus Dependentiae bacterium]|nr:rRNA (guanosine2251-2-O)-methyltransferase [Candidatus Dependentiae bacterium]
MCAAQKKVQQVGDVLYGAHPIIECLKSGRRKILALYMTKPEPKGWERVKPYLNKQAPSIQYVSRDVLSRMAGCDDHMGILAFVTPFAYAVKPITPQEKQRILLLDGVQDVHNLGAIVRSAYCTNFDAVLVTKQCARIVAGVFKASAGLAEHMPIYLISSVAHTINELKNMGYTVYTTVADGGVDATTVSYQAPLCVVIGSEERGIEKKVRSLGTQVTLPQRDTSSYNASVAAGIFLFLTTFSK